MKYFFSVNHMGLGKKALSKNNKNNQSNAAIYGVLCAVLNVYVHHVGQTPQRALCGGSEDSELACSMSTMKGSNESCKELTI